MKPVTPESLRREKAARARAREKLADEFERAAELLDAESGDFRQVVAHLHAEARRWAGAPSPGWSVRVGR